MRSVADAPRLECVDALRGFALFGVFAANLLIFSGIAYMSGDQRAVLFSSRLDSIFYWLELFLIENKFMGLFATLFGVSFWLFLDRALARGRPATALFYRRIFWLFVIGLAHGWLLWCFDILRFYALWAVLLPLFVRMPTRRLLGTALALSILVPAIVAAVDVSVAPTGAHESDIDAVTLAVFSRGSYLDVLRANWRYDWYLTLAISQIAYQVAVFGRLLLGLCIARSLNLGNLTQHEPLLRRVFLTAGIAGVAGSLVFANGWLSGGGGPGVAFVRRFIVESGHLGLTVTYASGLALVFLRGGRLQATVTVLAPVGRLALTCYLLQTILGIWLFYGFARGPAAMGQIPPSGLVAIVFVGFALQIAATHAWVARFRFGPAEWLWRGLTYAEMPPFKRE